MILVKISTGLALKIGGYVLQAVIVFMASNYGNKAAIKELQYATQLQINQLQYEDKLIWNRINMIAAATPRHEAIKPDEIKPKEEN
jgi:FKBP-type peptidyl-prolyl cis-trans isomerase (trigger factor)